MALVQTLAFLSLQVWDQGVEGDLWKKAEETFISSFMCQKGMGISNEPPNADSKSASQNLKIGQLLLISTRLSPKH